MKTTKLSFAISAVAAGQKSSTINAAPMLIANSTNGKFTATGAVTKALSVNPGENMMFFNNIAGVQAAIQNPNDEILAFAEENGIDINSIEGKNALIEALTTWYIAKGFKKYTKTGEPVMVNERVSKEDKEKYLNDHRMELVEANRELLIKNFELDENVSDEELAEKITIDYVAFETQDAEGSKTATTSTSTGIGLPLGFTDANVWTQLKKDISEDERTKINRYFKVDIENGVTIPMNNGFEDIDVLALPLEFIEDKAPVVRTKKNDGNED